MRFVSLLVLAPALAFAQANPAQRLPEQVITATLVPTTVSVPATVSVLRGDSLRARGITHLADALRLVPGVSVVTSSSFGSQTSLFVRGGQGNFTRVLLDGVVLNEPGGAINIGILTLDNIDRIEIVRGPASVLYGADALTGVIQLFSRRAGSGRQGALSVVGGSYGARDVAATGSLGGSRLGVSASVADRHTDGTLAFNNAYDNRDAAASVRFVPDARTETAVSANWQATTYHYPTTSTGAVQDRNAETTTHRLTVAFGGRRVLSDRLTASWNLTNAESSPRSNDGKDNAGDTLGFYGFYSRGTVTRRSADLRLTARAGTTQSFTLGASASRDHERSSTRSLSQYGVSNGAFEAARNERAVYVQGLGAFASRGSYQIGARLDDNSAFGTFRTMRVGAAWRLAGTWQARGAVGSAFRAPTFFENFATGYVRGNASLAPERTRTGELAVEGSIGAARVSVTGYRQRFHDLIQYTSKTAKPSDPNYFNVAAANADGVEAEVRAPLGRGLQGAASYAWLRSRVTDAGFDSGVGANLVLGQPLIRRPARTARVELGHAVAARGTFTVGASYTGRAADRNFSTWPAKPVWLEARTLLDAAATVRLSAVGARFPMTATLRGDNLTGVAYDGIFGFRAPGRSMRLGITVGKN